MIILRLLNSIVGFNIAREGMTDSSFVMVDGGPDPITDIRVLSKKESLKEKDKLQDFELVSEGCGCDTKAKIEFMEHAINVNRPS